MPSVFPFLCLDAWSVPLCDWPVLCCDFHARMVAVRGCVGTGSDIHIPHLNTLFDDPPPPLPAGGSSCSYAKMHLKRSQFNASQR